MGDLSPHFSGHELDCPCCGKFILNHKLLDLLETIREHFNVPIQITSGTRCKQHNAEVGGALRSLHLEGKAADIKVKGVDPEEVQDWLNPIHIGGLGSYKTFTHIDVRGYNARWKG